MRVASESHRFGRNRSVPALPARAFTLMDMLTTMAVVGVVAAAVTPLVSNDEQLHLMAASRIVSSDIELAQVMSMAQPSNPVVVRFDVDANAYWLARAATPDTPIARPDTGEDYRVVLGVGRASGAAGVTLAIQDASNDTLVFNPLGGIDDIASSPVVYLSTSGRWLGITVASMTGSMSESGGAGAAPGGGGGGGPVVVVAEADEEAAAEGGSGGSGGGGGASVSGLLHSGGQAIESLLGGSGGSGESGGSGGSGGGGGQ